MRINKHCPSISNLFYADDGLLFFKATDKYCRTIQIILGTYERVSGQTINIDKATFMVSPNAKRESIVMINDML